MTQVAFTVLLSMESAAVFDHWNTSTNVDALATHVAAVLCFYMREFRAITHTCPILYRYVDPSIAVPLQTVVFYSILTAVKPGIDMQLIPRLLSSPVATLAFGYSGDATFTNPSGAFFSGLCCRGFLLDEVFSGETGKTYADGTANST